MSGSPRNILFLLADQFRHDALGGAGGPHTPRLAALFANGLRFANAYTPLPVCAPARQALLTGRHPDADGAYWNYGFLPTPPLAPLGVSWPERLAARGSCGLYVGKWNASPTHGPEDFGFERCVGPEAHGALLKEKYPNLVHEGGWMGCESPVSLSDSQTHFLAQTALDLVRANDPGRPFHLWLDFGVPHLPCRPSAPFAGMYDPAKIPPWPGFDDPFTEKPFCHAQQSYNWGLERAEWPDLAPQAARYFAMVSQLDDAIGLLLDGLDADGLLSDTLVVFTSDHGDMCGSHRMLDKHYVLYDDVVRVPLILSGPGIPRGETSSALVSNCLDLPQTIAALLDLPPPPAAHGRPLPLRGEPGRDFITSSGNGQQFGMFNARMITDGRIKYVWNLTDVDELYDLATDPGELHNRIRDPALEGTLKTLRRLLYEELCAHEDPFAQEWLAPQLLKGRKCR